jgi:hypothetical protein
VSYGLLGMQLANATASSAEGEGTAPDERQGQSGPSDTAEDP